MAFLMLKQWKGTKLNNFCYLVEVSSKLSVLKERGFRSKNVIIPGIQSTIFTVTVSNVYVSGGFCLA